MNTTLTSLVVFGCLVGSVLIGITIRGLLPQAHLSTESKDAVKVATGLVATMSALVLGLLVSSAKGSYDIQRTEVIQMAAKVAFLNRLLTAYGPEAAGVRAQVRDMLDQSIQQMWPGTVRQRSDRNPNIEGGNLVYAALQHLSPRDNAQAALKSQATEQAVDIAQTRSLLAAQSVPSVSKAMLIILCHGLWSSL